jgi:hypothetical protein
MSCRLKALKAAGVIQILINQGGFMIGIDQKHRPTHRECHNTLKAVLIGLILIIGIVAGFSHASAALVAPCSIVGATTDDLMSPERAQFMVLYEHNEVIEDWDLQ